MEHLTSETPAAPAHARSRSRAAVTLAVVALLGWTLVASLFVVDVTEYALVTRFGAVVRVEREPGLRIKAPFDTVLRLEKSLTFSRPGQAEYLTVDKKNIVVESLVTWRVADPERYLVTLAPSIWNLVPRMTVPRACTTRFAAPFALQHPPNALPC